MSATDQRDALVEAANNLTAEVRKLLTEANKIAAILQSEADGLMLEAADEKTSHPTTRRITYKDAPQSTLTPNVSQSPVPDGKRKCGHCGASGHDKRNCPTLRKTYRKAK